MKSINLPEDLEPANDKFFTHPVVEWFLNNAGSTETINWNEVVDNKENKDNKDNKYKKLLARLLEITEMLVKKGGRGYFWLVVSPQMSNVFTGMKTIFASDFLDQFPLGYPIVLRMGILDKRWLIYSDLSLTNDTMLMGACFSKKHANYYCKIKVENYK